MIAFLCYTVHIYMESDYTKLKRFVINRLGSKCAECSGTERLSVRYMVGKITANKLFVYKSTDRLAKLLATNELTLRCYQCLRGKARKHNSLNCPDKPACEACKERRRAYMRKYRKSRK